MGINEGLFTIRTHEFEATNQESLQLSSQADIWMTYLSCDLCSRSLDTSVAVWRAHTFWTGSSGESVRDTSPI